MNIRLLLIIFIFSIQTGVAQLKITFLSKDGTNITADWYPENSDSQTIILCHQNAYSRGEFRETALKLNKLGFNCLAIDLRVGGEINGVVNQTADEARRYRRGQKYIDAEQDIVAAVEWFYQKYRKRVILLGSSYSASLVLKVANENTHVFAVAAFSPGEYFDSSNFVAKHVSGLQKPTFLTSSKEEAESVTELSKDIVSRVKVQFIPRGDGGHGSKVLWSTAPENQDYWAALISFLNRVKKERN